jgi:hypothetical protein
MLTGFFTKTGPERVCLTALYRGHILLLGGRPILAKHNTGKTITLENSSAALNSRAVGS